MIEPAPRTAIAALLIILTLAAAAIVTAMTRTSTTFDEIVMIAGGARGYETGEWTIAPEHPPLVQYMYGLPAYLSGPVFPHEQGVTPEMRAQMGYRYLYAQAFFWRSGNDPERLAFFGRLPAALCALALIALTFFYTRAVASRAAALLAAVIVAATPDVLAHGGVAYNDVPLALAFLGAVWAMDRAIRDPSIMRGLLAGAVIALAASIKNSAVALGPIALVLLVCEAVVRREDHVWRRNVAVAAAATIAGAYAVLVAVYRGDVTLTEYRYALDFAFGHVTQQRVPAFLLGSTSAGGWWYYFPVAFLFKTSAAFHLLVILAFVRFGTTARARPRRLLESRLRAPLVALLVFGTLLLSSDLNIGFRYAMPALPLLAILTASGIIAAWPVWSRSMRTVSGIAVVWMVLHVASFYPHFLGYVSEYGPGRDRNFRVLSDSSLDWGQGLLELRDFMSENDIPSVHLSYFGSALPEGYGIEYVAMPSFFALPPRAASREPRWVAISATNLNGTYFNGDPFARFRDAQPDHVLANSIFLYQLEEQQ